MQPPDIDWAQWLENIGLSALAGFAGLLGFVTRTLDAKERPSVMRAALEAFSSALIGFIVIMICRALKLDSYWTGAVCGVMGWMGAPASIKLLEKIIKRKLGVTDDAQKSPDNVGGPSESN